jgi:predicted amidophosphoribosyltransferase
VPVVAGVAAGALAWLVLDGVHGEEDAPLHSAAACPACGRPMLDDWRLCPHCGTLVGRESAGVDGFSANH